MDVLTFKIILVLSLFLLALTVAAYSTWAERKVAAIIQDRIGPNRAGPFGLLQPLADGGKFFFKEDFTPAKAEKFLFMVGPSLVMFISLITGAVIPWGKTLNIGGTSFDLQVANVDVGVLYLVGMVSIGVYGIMIGGWASNNKFSLIGAIRASSQMISYELALGLSLLASARLRLARKEYTKAFDDFQQVLGRYPNTRRFNEIVGEQYRIASALLDGARGRMLWGMLPGFTQRDKAIEYFETILVNAPYSDYAPLSLMNVARGHQRLGNIPEAIDALDRMINNYSQTLLAPDAYLKLAQTHAALVDGPYYDQGSTKEAITYFTDFMLLFPSDTNINAAEKGLDNMKTMLAESKMRMADFYFYKRSNYKAARVFYNEAITAYPESAIAQRAKNRLAEVEARANNQPAPAPAPGAGAEAPKKKRFWIF